MAIGRVGEGRVYISDESWLVLGRGSPDSFQPWFERRGVSIEVHRLFPGLRWSSPVWLQDSIPGCSRSPAPGKLSRAQLHTGGMVGDRGGTRHPISVARRRAWIHKNKLVRFSPSALASRIDFGVRLGGPAITQSPRTREMRQSDGPLESGPMMHQSFAQSQDISASCTALPKLRDVFVYN